VAATPEAKVKKRVKEILKTLGAYYVMPVTGGYGSSGAPDFLVCYMGKFIGIECKTRSGRVTALQQRNLDLIDDAGGWSFVINEENVEQLVNLSSLIK
jgi:Holliday junction resolvase